MLGLRPRTVRARTRGGSVERVLPVVRELVAAGVRVSVDRDDAVAHGVAMHAAGADLVDVGGEQGPLSWRTPRPTSASSARAPAARSRSPTTTAAGW
jgi:hypothetical protein